MFDQICCSRTGHALPHQLLGCDILKHDAKKHKPVLKGRNLLKQAWTPILMELDKHVRPYLKSRRVWGLNAWVYG